jgi:hypothetical protein
MQSRGLRDPESAAALPAFPASHPALHIANPDERNDSTSFSVGTDALQLVPSAPESENDDEHPREYTWKTPLCTCDSREEAMCLMEVLRRAGIESWINFDGYTTSFIPSLENRFTTGGLQILVAADQLDRAHAIAAAPIPQEIADEANREIPEFVEPKCPKCGSDDVVLDGVEPVNTWRCEQCDAEWTEALPEPGEETGDAPRRAL